MACLCTVIVLQENNNVWVTNTFRVQFQDNEQGLQVYNGCYEKNENVISRKEGFGRKLYEGFESNSENARFGYCLDDRRWILFKGDIPNACAADKNGYELARSSKTDTFDVSTMFDETWISVINTPLDVFFFEDNGSIEINEETCSSFLDDGKCDLIFNNLGYLYDGGDCCAATCSGSNCGIEMLTNAFGTNDTTGDGFPDCEDPDMVPITIRLDNMLTSRDPQFYNDGDIISLENVSDINSTIDNFCDDYIDDYIDDYLDDCLTQKFLIQQLLSIDCDERNVLSIHIDKSMENQMETIMVNDGAECTVTFSNATSGVDPNWSLNYTIFYGERNFVQYSATFLGIDKITVLQSSSADESNFVVDLDVDCEYCFLVSFH